MGAPEGPWQARTGLHAPSRSEVSAGLDPLQVGLKQVVLSREKQKVVVLSRRYGSEVGGKGGGKNCGKGGGEVTATAAVRAAARAAAPSLGGAQR